MPNVTAEYRWRSLFNAAVWMTPTTRVPCSNAAKTRNPLKFAGVPQTPEPISAASAPKFTEVHYQDMWRRYCCLTSFFPIVDTSLSCEDIARHPEFALRPHHVWKYGIDSQSATAEIRRGKKNIEKESTGQKYNVRIRRAAISSIVPSFV